MSDQESEQIAGAQGQVEGGGNTLGVTATVGKTSTEAGKADSQDIQPMDDSLPTQPTNEDKTQDMTTTQASSPRQEGSDTKSSEATADKEEPMQVAGPTSSRAADNSSTLDRAESKMEVQVTSPRGKTPSSSSSDPLPGINWKQVPSTTGPIPRPRHGHRAVTIKELIIIFGGGNEGIIDELNVLNTGTNQWFAPATRGEVPSGCAAFGFISDGVRLLIFGGMLEYGRYSSDLYELLASRWEWRRLTPLGATPCPRLGHTFIMVDQKAVVFGGLSNEADDPKSTNLPKYLNDIFYFEVKEGTTLNWIAPVITGQPPIPRESHTAIAYSGKTGDEKKMIIYGGMNGKRLGDCHILDVITWTWVKLEFHGINPPSRSLHTSSLIGNYMYVFGGWCPKKGCETEQPKDVQHMESVWECTNTLSRLNLESMTWETIVCNKDGKSPLPKPRAGHCAAVVDTRVYIWSGRDGFNRGWDEQQVCCDDLWYLETDRPPAPSRVQLVRAGTSTLEVSWGYVSSADEYLLQIQLYQVKKQSESQPVPTTPEGQPSPTEWYDVDQVKKTSMSVSKYRVPGESEEGGVKENLVELQVGTAYKFRVAAINSCGRGPFSEMTAFKTCLPGFPGAPSTIRITKVNEGAQLSWEPPANSTADILEYTVYLAVKPSTVSQQTNQLTFARVYVGAKATCIVSQAHLTNAHVDTSSKPAILFRIAAKNEKGYGPATQVRWLQENAPKRPAVSQGDDAKKSKSN